MAITMTMTITMHGEHILHELRRTTTTQRHDTNTVTTITITITTITTTR